MSISQNELVFDEVLKTDDLNNLQEPINRLGNGDRIAAASKPKKKRQHAPTGAKPAAVSRERSTPPPPLFFSDREVAIRYSVSRPTIWRWVKEIVDFPEPVKIAKGTTRWHLDDLVEYERVCNSRPIRQPMQAGTIK